MKLPRRNFLHLAATAAALPAISRFAWAQAYPARPVKIIVGQAAGSASDIVARLVAQFLSEKLGQQFLVEVRPGAAGNIATEAVVNQSLKGAPDIFRGQENVQIFRVASDSGMLLERERARNDIGHLGVIQYSQHLAKKLFLFRRKDRRDGGTDGQRFGFVFRHRGLDVAPQQAVVMLHKK